MSTLDLDFSGLDINSIDVNLKHLYYFVIAAESGNITRAAQRLYMSQPLLSKNIIALEEKVGFPLFYRKERTLVLTSGGKYLYNQWKAAVHSFCAGIEHAQLMQHNAVDMLRVGCFPVLNTYSFLNRYTTRMYKRHPELEIEMYRMNYIRLFDHLRSHKVDVIFTLLEDIPENVKGIEVQGLFQLPMVAVVSENHEFYKRDSLSMQELNYETVLLNEPLGNLSRTDTYSEIFKKYKLEDCQVKYVNNDLTAYLEAEHNHGIALGIKALYPAHNRKVKVIPIENCQVTVSAAWNEDIPQELKHLLSEFCG